MHKPERATRKPRTNVLIAGALYKIKQKKDNAI